MRHTVVSVRVTTEEHDRLRAVADARGLSISDLIRSFIDQETAPPSSAAKTIGCPADLIVDGLPVGADAFFWDVPEGAVVNGKTLTLSAS